jgi:hypothetical protein
MFCLNSKPQHEANPIFSSNQKKDKQKSKGLSHLPIRVVGIAVGVFSTYDTLHLVIYVLRVKILNPGQIELVPKGQLLSMKLFTL